MQRDTAREIPDVAASGQVALDRSGPGPRSARGARVVAMSAEHGEQVLAIYRAGIADGNATFEVQAPSWAEFSAARLPGHRYVAVDLADPALVLGWVAISATSGRPA